MIKQPWGLARLPAMTTQPPSAPAEHLAVVHALTQRVVTTRQQLELADVVRRTAQRPEVPVYLDVSA